MTTLHKADTRGCANHGWLNAKHSFSFANYYNPERMHFGVLRVLNDDTIAPGMGFGTHPHDNMEIITIPLSGQLEHKDSMGNSGLVTAGEIQVMSAGTGIEHSEKNASRSEELKLFQIWLIPNKKNVAPRYQQQSINTEERNRLHQILSLNEEDDGVWIHQDAWFHMGNFDAGHSFLHQLKNPSNGLYLMVVEGTATIDGQNLNTRDAIAIESENSISIKAETDCRLLLIEVPFLIEN